MAPEEGGSGASAPSPVLAGELARGKREKRVLVGITIAALVGALVYLAVSGLGSGTRWDLTVSQAAARIGEYADAGRDVRVRGKFVDDSLAKLDGDKFGVTFEIFGETDKIRVVYFDKAPDPLVNGADVTVEGKFQSDGRFLASRVYAKCPSKYEAEYRARGGAGHSGYRGQRVGSTR